MKVIELRDCQSTHKSAPCAFDYSNLISNFCLQLSPTRRNNNGRNPRPIAINASRELPHPRPSLSYIGSPASGISDPAIARKMLAAANALAAYVV